MQMRDTAKGTIKALLLNAWPETFNTKDISDASHQLWSKLKWLVRASLLAVLMVMVRIILICVMPLSVPFMIYMSYYAKKKTLRRFYAMYKEGYKHRAHAYIMLRAHIKDNHDYYRSH